MKQPAFFTDKTKSDIFCAIAGDGRQLGEAFHALLPAGSEDGAKEKHLPAVQVNGSTVLVEVGSVPHPMTKEHSIGWIYLETAQGGQLKYLSPDQTPRAEFSLTADDRAIAAYAYCNLHGFWKTAL